MFFINLSLILKYFASENSLKLLDGTYLWYMENEGTFYCKLGSHFLKLHLW